MTKTTVIIPATTANLGPGFDCIGAALTLYNQFQFSLMPEAVDAAVKIAVSGSEAEGVSTGEDNLLYRAWTRLYQEIGKNPPPVAIDIQLGVPLARGLGSSATAIVGGLLAANQLAGNPLERQAVMELAIALEGHPDNVVPALLGGCQLAAGEMGRWQICDVPWHPDIVPVVAIPDFELSTEAARAVLPNQISRSDTIFNIAHLGLLLRGLETGRGEWLQAAMADRLHQPYRQSLIPGYAAVAAAALSAGAFGMAISGAGPTLLALAPTSAAAAVASAMEAAWQEEGVKSESRLLALDLEGARCV
jgi:homoserine kinase